MNICLLMPLVFVALITGGAIPAAAKPVTSANYSITTTVMSGGGALMGSTIYQINTTMGQPSPLMIPTDPPISASYHLLSGFWYTIGIVLPISLCPADFEPDGDVDVDDLRTLAAGYGRTSVSKDADGDLDMDGLDLYEMAVDFNRSDCFP